MPEGDKATFRPGHSRPWRRKQDSGALSRACLVLRKAACGAAGYLFLFSILSAPAGAVELTKETVAAFERYVRLTETRIQGEVNGSQRFLWMDGMAEPRRQALYGQLRQGEIVVERLETRENGQEIEIPDGRMHHWLGAVFIPGTTLKDTLLLIKDYDRHQSVYKPEVLQSKMLSHKGNDYKIFLRLWKHKLITVVLNTEHDVHYFPVSATREYSRSYTTRIAEVDDPGEPTEKEKPVGNDGGFLWRLYSYWRFEEKEGGVYVQCEALSLTRNVPLLLRPIVNPFITGLPREALRSALLNTRTALQKRPAAGFEAQRPGGASPSPKQVE